MKTSPTLTQKIDGNRVMTTTTQKEEIPTTTETLTSPPGKLRRASFHALTPKSPPFFGQRPLPKMEMNPRGQSFQEVDFPNHSKVVPNRPVKANQPLDSDFKIKYKTEVCSNWENTGECEFGESCAFAHGAHELRAKMHVSMKYKTKKCRQFHTYGFCQYGSRCQFIHDEQHQTQSLFSSPQLGPDTQDDPINAIDYFHHSKEAEEEDSAQQDAAKKRLRMFEKLTTDGGRRYSEAINSCDTDEENDDIEFKAFVDPDVQTNPRKRVYSFFS